MTPRTQLPTRAQSRARRPSRTALVAGGSLLLFVVLTTVAACTSGSEIEPSSADGAATSGTRGDKGSGDVPVAAASAVPSAAGGLPGGPGAQNAPADTADGAGGAGGDLRYSQASPVQRATDPDAQQPAIIKTAKIVLKDKDVAKARFDLLDVSDSVGGEIADEQSSSDKDGVLNATRLVLRVPTAKFEDAVGAIGEIGDQVVSEVHADDVTTQVVDIAARLKVQRASVDRITRLLDRAQSIRDIVSIEGQLSQRTAALESLEQQQSYLADQTSLSTITVRVEKEAAEAAAATRGQGRATASYHGFVGGFVGGWNALGHFGNGVAIVGGALLPWLVVGLLLGVPAFVLARRLRARRRPVVAGDAGITP